jgi:RND family efflux transporter MFP subunit
MPASVALVVPLLVFAGCGRAAKPSAPPPPKVSVVVPRAQEIVEWDQYTGRLQAIESVEVRPRVSGYLESIHFSDGAMVKKGDLLFVIDPRPYEAVLKQARAEVDLSQARLDLAREDLARGKKLLLSRAISQEEVDTRAAAVRQAEASIAGGNAAVDAAALDVEFTHVVAPVTGRAGRHLVSEGNLIAGGATNATLLTTIVSLDPIHCYFDADERAYLKYVRLDASGERPSSRTVRNPVQIALADEDGFPHSGYMDFVDNQLDPNTGTIIGRAVVENPQLILSPGLFVRVRLLGSGRYQALLVPDEAVIADQADKVVWVIGADSHAQYRRVTTGPLQDGLRIIRSGIAANERVAVSGIQRIRPGIEVDATEVGIAPAATAAEQANAAE